MKKTLILFFGLIMFTGSICPPSLSVEVMPCNVYREVLKEGPCLPVYVPGSIKLHEGGIFAGFPSVPTKRYIYYGISSGVLDLASDNGSAFIDILEKTKGEDRDVMVMADFVKYYNISKTDFEKAIETEYQLLIRLGLDTTEEYYELPNADIVYTFNNTIINYYYRRV